MPRKKSSDVSQILSSSRGCAGIRRPVVVVRCDAPNTSRAATTVCIPLTSNLKWEAAPGNGVKDQRLLEFGKVNLNRFTCVDSACGPGNLYRIISPLVSLRQLLSHELSILRP